MTIANESIVPAVAKTPNRVVSYLRTPAAKKLIVGVAVAVTVHVASTLINNAIDAKFFPEDQEVTPTED